MNTSSNFTTVNGWCLPGSGTWVAQDTEDFYVDCNGDLWVPCFCDGEEEDGEGLGRAAEAQAPAAAKEKSTEPPEPPAQ